MVIPEWLSRPWWNLMQLLLKGGSGRFGYGSDSGFISGGEQSEDATGQFH
jgi:hypothetical protein